MKVAAPMVRSPYPGGIMPRGVVVRPSAEPLPPRDLVTICAEPPPPSHHLGRFTGAALMLGLTLAGLAAPVAAQAAEAAAPPPTSVSTTVAPAARAITLDPGQQAISNDPVGGTPAPATGTIHVPGLPLPLPDIPLPPLPPLPVPDSQPQVPARVNMTGAPYATLGVHSLSASHDRSYVFGELDQGRRLGLDVRKGAWRSETGLDLGTKLRMGSELGPSEPAGSISLGGTVSEKLSREINSATHVYGRGVVGLQGGLGTRFDRDDPLNAFRAEGALGVEYTTGPTLFYTEPFAETVQGLGGGLTHDQLGVRVGAEHRLSETEQVAVEAKASHYDYSDGVHTPAYGVKVGYERRDGGVWWGPEVGYEHRNNDNRVTAGISVRF